MRDPFRFLSLTDFHIRINDVKTSPKEKIAQDLYINEDSMGYLMAHVIMAAGSKPATQSPAFALGLEKLSENM